TVYKYENIYVNGEWVKNITGTIGSVYFGELGVSEEKTDVVEWTPTEQGYYRLILVVNASEDIDWENNYDYESAYVVMPGPNIEGWANVHYHVIVNETNNITLYVENEGTETSQNVTATVHEYELGYIDGESVEVIVDTIGGVYFGDVDAGEYKSDIIPWTPEEQRHYNLMLVVNASEDIDWENNYDYYGVQARYDGPDLSVYVPYPDNDLIANEVNPVEVEVYNHGTETATEVELTIYDLYNNQYTNIGYGAGVYYNEILYEFNLDWIADYLVNLTVNYNNITEQFTVVQDKTIILQNGVALAIDYISSERRLSLIFTEVSQVVTESVPNIGVYELWEGFVNITPTITGTHILAASVSSLNDISQYNDYDLRYVTVIEEGPNVYGDLYVEYDSIVNETNNITIEVGNVGTEIATNVNATVYEYEWEYVDGEDVMIIVDTIGSVYIGDLGVDQSTTEIIEWTPAEQRHYMFMLVVNSSWDVNPNNNIDYDSSYAQVSAPDLHIYITENDMGIVNQTGTISLEVRNTGIETATNVNSTLYNFYNCEYELIRFGDTETMYHNDVEYHISADWVFDEYAVFNVNYNNQTEQLLVYNNGYGVLSNNVFLTIRYSSESSLRFYMCEELEGVATQDIADIEPGYQNFVGLEMNWTPYTEGAHLLKIFVDANEDHYWADNVVTSNVNVVMPGPNMKANHIIINKVDKDTVIIINQSTVVYTSVSNVGTETANNVSVKLYLNYYGNDDEEDVEPGLPADPINETEGNETGGNSSSGGGSGGNETDEGAEPEVIDDDLEEITEEIEYSYLIDEYYLGDLEANEEALYNFTWTPNATGWETLALVVNSSYDVYDGNNVRYNSVRVRPNSSDILYYYYFPKQTMVNETYNLNIDLNNVGIVDAENVFIELRDNGVLLYSNFVGTLEVDDWFWDQYIWTPQYVGEHNMTFFMNYTDNTGYNEILDMETVNVLEPISVLMTINNPDGGYEPTTVVYDDWYYITEPTQLTMPNTSTNIGFLKLFNQDNDDEGVFTGFRDSTPQSEMTATSSVYYNLTDGGLFFNIVYANEVNWVTFQNEFEFRASNSWFEYDDNLALYQCTDFDFGTDSCVNGWDVADDYEFGSFSSNYLSVQGISFSPVEAFGVGYYVEDVNDTNVTVYERECLIILDPIYKNNCEYTPKYDSKGICLTGYDEQCNIAIIDAKWSESSVDDGNSVELIVECDNCEGEEVVFTIIENDLLVDNEIIELTGTIKDGVVTVDWEAEWVNDAFWPLSNDPEFYFEVNVGGETAFSPYLAVFSVSGNESQPPTVDSIDIQEGYEVTDYIWANGQLVAKVVEGNE
ncbi:hypothetical protein HQ529_03935, partial [Candidatus Woesearchaeota archaeon]|nr:hypothetical protein [Candidatus Woesearchaeota archaeon]